MRVELTSRGTSSSRDTSPSACSAASVVTFGDRQSLLCVFAVPGGESTPGPLRVWITPKRGRRRLAPMPVGRNALRSFNYAASRSLKALLLLAAWFCSVLPDLRMRRPLRVRHLRRNRYEPRMEPEAGVEPAISPIPRECPPTRTVPAFILTNKEG